MEQPLPRILSLSGPWSVCAAADAASSIEDCSGDPGAWSSLDIPAPVQSALGPDFRGKAWLRRRIDMLARTADDERLWLAFLAVATDCTVWINGQQVGRHTGDYLPFEFDITSHCAGGTSIEITLLIDQMNATKPDRDGDLQRGHITKGFHDVLSIQHAGVWDDCFIVQTAPLRIVPDGVAVRADAESGQVDVAVAIEPHHARGRCRLRILDPQGCDAASTSVAIESGQREIHFRAKIEDVRRWAPAHPNLYRAIAEVDIGGRASDRRDVPFGFRKIRAAGHSILLNDQPVFLRGVLHWGHEPRHMAPAPTEHAIRADFARLRAMGFNCVCLCMWYPPRRYFEIADETGMLIWQEHPVWQSAMDDELLPEYRRNYRAFMQRDVNHPSVVIVSATCEHPCFHRELARWWWDTAREVLPDKLLQVQTAFIKWADLERTDLYDEHTYDGSDRWVCYVDDVQKELSGLPTKPFVMGETIAFSSWPNISGMLEHTGDDRPWWLPRAFEHMCALERQWSERYGAEVVARFRAQSVRFARLSRKFQVEQFRRHAAHAGLVMNHLNDVPAGQFGFRDDLGEWRFEPDEVRPWLSDVAVLLWTPDHRRGFAGGGTLPAQLAVSNFGSADVDGRARVRLAAASRAGPAGAESILEFARVSAARGKVSSVNVALPLPAVETPTVFGVEADIDGAPTNHWELWLLPRAEPNHFTGVYRFDALPFTDDENRPDDVERGYSRGYGIATRSWRSVLPDPAIIAPAARSWNGHDAPPRDCSVLLTHRLTGSIIDWLAAGGSAILFASKAAGALDAQYESLYGQMPLIIERGLLRPGDSQWLLDLLAYDLIRLHSRVIPSEQLGILDQVDPLIRCVYTHDQRERLRFFDQLFIARVGDGLLIVSSLDHCADAGQYLLHQMAKYLLRADAGAERAIDTDLLRRITVDAQVLA